MKAIFLAKETSANKLNAPIEYSAPFDICANDASYESQIVRDIRADMESQRANTDYLSFTIASQ